MLFRLQDLAQTLPQRSKEINVLSDILWATRCSRIKRMCYHVSTTKKPFDTIHQITVRLPFLIFAKMLY